ncbi:MAG: uroporphyrinogen-III synthase, partial [Micrococcus sp.]|nr:uroporphyrinogen-III synthase [Micrococcus sp.]
TAPVWVPEQHRSATGLLRGLSVRHDPARTRVWLPQSDLSRDDLADGLATAGFTVHRVQAYATRPYPVTPEH